MAIQAQMYPDNLGLPLGGSQDWLMMDNCNNNNIVNNNNNNLFNGCGFNELSFNLLQKQQLQQQFQFQQQQQQQQQQLLVQQFQNQQQRIQHQNQSLSSDAGFVFMSSSSKNNNNNNNNNAQSTSTTTTSSDHMPSSFSQTLATQLEKQRQEIDRYISLQNERLKLALQEQRKQQLATLMRKLEAKAMMLLKQKDDEIAKATKRTMELEEFMSKMELENQAWQRVAAENEAMVVSLNNSLEQLKEQACCLTSSNGVDDAESCCDDNDYPPPPCNNNNNNNGRDEEEEATTGENRGERNMNVNINNMSMSMSNKTMMMMMCRVCNSRKSCVLMLPCRHLCSCKACDAFLDACPVCKSVKKASIEAFLS